MFGSSSDEDEGGQKKTFFQRLRDPAFLLMFLALLLFIIGMLVDLGEVTYGRHIIGAWGLFTFAIAAKSVEMGLKYMSPKIVTETISSSTTGEIYRDENWAATRLGGIKYGITKEGNEGTIFFPISSAHPIGVNFVLKALPKPYKYEELGPKLQEMSINFKLPSPFFVALTSEEQELIKFSDPEIIKEIPGVEPAFIEGIWKETNIYLTMTKDLLRGKIRSVQDLAAGLARIQDKVDRKSTKQKLKSQFGRDKGGE